MLTNRAPNKLRSYGSRFADDFEKQTAHFCEWAAVSRQVKGALAPEAIQTLGPRRLRRRRTRAVLRHEGVELFLVLGVAQAVEEVAEFNLLFLEPAQRVGAVFVEGAVA